MLPVALLFVLEVGLLLAFAQFLPGGVILFLIFGIVALNCLAFLFSNVQLVARTIFLGLCFAYLWAGIHCWRIRSHAEEIVAQLDRLKGEGKLTSEIARDVITHDQSYSEYFTNVEVSDNSNYVVFFYYLRMSISHWYSSETGWGHSDD